MNGFSKLSSAIITSTIWQEDNPTRIVWITLLASSDALGRVEGSIPGLAHIARVTVEECEHALDRLMSPDQYSRTKDHEGRRIEEIDGGWRILNYGKYREKRDPEKRREQNREAKRRQRKRQTPDVSQKSANVSQCQPESAQAEAEADINPPTPQGGDAVFGRFWQSYPKKVAKPTALRAWKRLSPGKALAEIIIADVGRRRSSPEWLKDSGQYIPNPATYLNNHRWEDEAVEVRADEPTNLPLDVGADGLTPRQRALQATGGQR